VNDELLARGIRARQAELMAQLGLMPSGRIPAKHFQAQRVGMRMPRHVRPRPGQVRAYQPLPRY
jgi:hypothetical protein